VSGCGSAEELLWWCQHHAAGSGGGRQASQTALESLTALRRRHTHSSGNTHTRLSDACCCHMKLKYNGYRVMKEDN